MGQPGTGKGGTMTARPCLWIRNAPGGDSTPVPVWVRLGRNDSGGNGADW